VSGPIPSALAEEGCGAGPEAGGLGVGSVQELLGHGEGLGGSHAKPSKALASGPLLSYSLGRVRRMTKLERLIEKARELPAPDRLRLIEAIEGSVESETRVGAPRPVAYGPLLAIAGTAVSEFTDVSTDKYRHVAEAYAPRPGDE